VLEIKNNSTFAKNRLVKNYIVPLLLLLTLFAACKKEKASINTSMTLFVKGDSTWTTTNVTATRETSNSVVVKGNNTSAYETISLTLADYREGRKIYYIGSSSAPKSQAAYEYGGYLEEATTGEIVITNFGTKTMEGTFDFSNIKVHVRGTFSAPIP
jgi:hypothetical protein